MKKGETRYEILSRENRKRKGKREELKSLVRSSGMGAN